MRNYDKKVNKDWQLMFNIHKLLFQDILARLCGPSQAWLQYVHCQTQNFILFWLLLILLKNAIILLT